MNIFWKKIEKYLINVKRERRREFHRLFNDLKEDEQRFKSHFRMMPQTFYTILDLITEDLQKQQTNYQKPVSPEERLALTLPCISYVILMLIKYN